ncbi:MAG: hypothetical protein WC582_03635 [Patescibacteria group bacterium]
MYQKTQFGKITTISLILALLIIGYFGVYYSNFSSLLSAAFFLFGIFLLSLLLFYKLTVIVDDHNIQIIFGVGLIRKKFSLSDINSCQSVKNHWYYGLGIHLTPRGWLYNVSGLRAVEIIMKDGNKCRIGTDDPEGLIKAIQN